MFSVLAWRLFKPHLHYHSRPASKICEVRLSQSRQILDCNSDSSLAVERSYESLINPTLKRQSARPAMSKSFAFYFLGITLAQRLASRSPHSIHGQPGFGATYCATFPNRHAFPRKLSGKVRLFARGRPGRKMF